MRTHSAQRTHHVSIADGSSLIGRPSIDRRLVPQLISAARLVATVAVAILIQVGGPLGLAIGLYAVAALSDLIDGYMSRRLHAVSHFGLVVDLVADKSLTVFSVIYASGRGIDVLPLTVIALREVVMIGLRLVVVDDRQLLPTSRFFGGLTAGTVWIATFLLLLDVRLGPELMAARLAFWCVAAAYAVNLGLRLHTSEGRLRAASRDIDLS